MQAGFGQDVGDDGIVRQIRLDLDLLAIESDPHQAKRGAPRPQTGDCPSVIARAANDPVAATIEGGKRDEHNGRVQNRCLRAGPDHAGIRLDKRHAAQQFTKSVQVAL